MRLPLEIAKPEVQTARSIHPAVGEHVALDLVEPDAAGDRLRRHGLLDLAGEIEVVLIEGNRPGRNHVLVDRRFQRDVRQQIGGGAIEDDLDLRLSHHRSALGDLVDAGGQRERFRHLRRADEIERFGACLHERRSRHVRRPP